MCQALISTINVQVEHLILEVISSTTKLFLLSINIHHVVPVFRLFCCRCSFFLGLFAVAQVSANEDPNKKPSQRKKKTELLGVVKRLVAAAAELFASSQWD